MAGRNSSMQFVVGYYSGLQSVVEVGLGSLLHAFHIPFSGHALSLNQALILSVASKKVPTRREAVSAVNGISVVAAVLKSLSPIGKRLTPMLAISVQGFLFSLGIFTFGHNQVGVLMGAGLLSLWSFIQPLLFAYLFFGDTLFLAIQTLWLDISEKLNLQPEAGPALLLTFLAAKVILAFAVAVLGWRYHHYVSDSYFKKIVQFSEKVPIKIRRRSASSAVVGAVRDLSSPWMILSIIISVIFLMMTQKANYVVITAYILRVIAVAWISFWVIRAFPQEWIQKILNWFPKLKEAVDHVAVKAEPKHLWQSRKDD